MSLPFQRWWPAFVAIMAVLLLATVAGCGDDDEGGAGDGGGERIEGGELTVQSNDVTSFDPHFSSLTPDISLYRMVWRGLYTLNGDNIPEPAMASGEPEVSEDGLTYTITLREGLKWSDGDDLTADDFVAGIYRTCNPENAGEYVYLVVNIGGCNDHYSNEAYDAELEEAIGVAAVDPTTIEFSLLEPQPTFPIILSLWMTFPSPVHLFPNSSDPWPSSPDAPDQLVYNGPYILTSYSPQDNVTLEPNPEWAAPAGVKPTLDRITIKFIDDLAQSANAYRTGEIQATDVDLAQLETLISEFGEGEEYFSFVAPATIGMNLQLETPPLDKLEVRLALSQAIDRAELNRVVFQGGNAPTTSWIPEVSGGHEPDVFDDDIGFDPEKARENLAKAGYPDGEGFPELTILVGNSPEFENEAQFLQQAFKTHLNIDVQIDVVDFKTQFERFTEEQFELLSGVGWLQDYPDPENWVVGQFDSAGTVNHVNCNDSDIDSLIEEAHFNTDDEKRREQYKEINELIVTRLCGVIPYRHSNRHWLIAPNVVGIREHLAGQDFNMPGDWASEYWGVSE